jgi:hypothetical protein
MTGPIISPTKEEDLAELHKMALADHHSVILPSHTVKKGNQIIGCLSIAQAPMVLVYMNTERSVAIDSYCVSNLFENLLAAHGSKSICVPCHVKSPLRPYMESVGYKAYGTHDIMIKDL